LLNKVFEQKNESGQSAQSDNTQGDQIPSEEDSKTAGIQSARPQEPSVKEPELLKSQPMAEPEVSEHADESQMVRHREAPAFEIER
jgi:hypothetical protein